MSEQQQSDDGSETIAAIGLIIASISAVWIFGMKGLFAVGLFLLACGSWATKIKHRREKAGRDE